MRMRCFNRQQVRLELVEPRWFLPLIFLLGAVWGIAEVQAQPPSWPTDSDWVAMKDQAGNNLYDNDGDNVNGVRNLVGDASNPTGYIYNNGTWQYFRMRLESSPDKNATSYDNFGWGILIDTRVCLKNRIERLAEYMRV